MLQLVYFDKEPMFIIQFFHPEHIVFTSELGEELMGAGALARVLKDVESQLKDFHETEIV